MATQSKYNKSVKLKGKSSTHLSLLTLTYFTVLLYARVYYHHLTAVGFHLTLVSQHVIFY